MSISITRALNELKLLDKRIDKSIEISSFTNYHIGNKTIQGYNNNQEFIDKAKANFQSIKDLIERRNKIKTAIVKSNAETVVTIAGKKMTVAEAIERKNSINYEKDLLGQLRSEYTSILNTVDRHNQKVEERLDRHIETILGSDRKGKETELEAITKAFKNENEAKIVDSIDVKKVIEELENDIEQFESEVDIVLVESNSSTMIDVD